MASSSSSSHQQKEEHHAFSGIELPRIRRKVDESSRLFDVFINHRGPDVKQTLATTLYESLQQLGIRAFLDSKEKELGDSFPSTVEKAIGSAAVHIAIFSPGYAESPWCLAELVLMIQSQAKIIPVFYDVEPWEVRYVEKGVYAEAFSDYEKKDRYLEKLKEWKEALQSVSFITGEEFDRFSECKTIVSAVEKEIQRLKKLPVAKYPVGLDRLVEEFERRSLDQIVKDFDRHCAMREEMKDKAKIVGIFGMGGVGKTTLSKELFNRKKLEYNGTSFLFDVRETSARSGLASLQNKLLKDLFKREPPNFQSTEEGTIYLSDCLRRSSSVKFLIIIDDIDHVEQLDALLVMEMLNKCPGSLIIITTRDVGVLISAGINVGYQLKGMDRNYGIELFCWHAFDQPRPVSGYKGLVEDFVGVCGGLPLSLQVLGRDVRRRTRKYWLSVFCELRKTLPQDIVKKLRISFEALKNEEKQIFMDIACFFVNKPKNVAMRSWEGSGWSAHLALERLKEKCLVEEIKIWRMDQLGPEPRWVGNRCGDMETDLGLRMHDHLRDLGREIAIELNHPRRLWRPQYLKSLESKGFHDILSQSQPKDRCFHSIFDQSMNCQITYFLGASDDSPQTSTSILWLQLDYLPLHLNASTHPDILSWIPLENLQCLRINNGHLERLWQRNVQAPSQLKELQIVGTTLEVFPDLSRIADLTKLIELNISKCPELEELNVAYLSCLEKMIIENCQNWRRVSGISDLTKLIELNISECPVLEPELSLVGMNCLESVTVDGCRKLKSLKMSVCKNLKRVSGMKGIKDLAILNICECPELQYLDCLEGLSCLEMITIDRCERLNNIKFRSCENLKRVSGKHDLKGLSIDDCSEIPELLFDIGLQTCIQEISINNCGKHHNILLPIFNLKKLEISHCPEFEELSVAHLSCLEIMIISFCQNLRRVSGISNLTKLIELNIFVCPVLEPELSLVGMNCLESVAVNECRKLKSFQLSHCKNLKKVWGMVDLKELAILNICECPELEDLACLDGLSCLETIIIDRCGRLNKIKFQSCENLERVLGKLDLKGLDIEDCSEIPELLFDIGRQTCIQEISIYDCGKLRNILLSIFNLKKLEISECPEFEELSVAHLSCLEEMIIENCQNLRRIPGISYLSKLIKLSIFECPELEELKIAHLSCLEIMIIVSCQNLRRVTGISYLTKLIELNISKCPEFELEELNVAYLSCLEKMIIKNCQKLRRVSGISDLTKLIELNISECPVLEPELSLEGMNCLESVTVNGCRKLKSLKMSLCKKLKRVSGMEGLEQFAILNICKCPELECLKADLQGPNCLEMITIDGCGKLNRLELKNCARLKTVGGLSDLAKLSQLRIIKSLEIEELPSLARLSCLEYLLIYKCEKLQSITGIQQLSALKNVLIAYCNNAVMRNCIDMLQSVPSLEFMVVIGRAADEAESSLTPELFEAECAVIEIDPRSEDHLEMKTDELSAVIVCAVVVVESSTQLEKIKHEMEYNNHTFSIAHHDRTSHMAPRIIKYYTEFNEWDHSFYMEGVGEWIITKVIIDADRIISYNHKITHLFGFRHSFRSDRGQENILAGYGIWRKGFRVMVKKGEEWKTLHVLKTIINRLHAN